MEEINLEQKESLCYYLNLDTGEEKVFPKNKFKENIGYDLNTLPDIDFTIESIINNQGKSIGSKIVIPLL